MNTSNNFNRIVKIKIYNNYEEQIGKTIQQTTQTLFEYSNVNSTDNLIITADIIKQNFSNIGKATFTIKNISKTHANRLHYDIMDITNNKQFVYLDFYAGYNSTGLVLLFRGIIRYASPSLQQSDSIITLTGDEGGFDILNNIIDVSFEAGTSYYDICKFLCAKYSPRYKIVISKEKAQQKLLKKKTFKGKVLQLLQEYYGNEGHNIYVSNLELFVMDKKYSETKNVLIIDDKIIMRGGSPARPQGDPNPTLKTIFLPSLQLSDMVDIKSSYITKYNGRRKISGIRHIFSTDGALSNTDITFMVEI